VLLKGCRPAALPPAGGFERRPTGELMEIEGLTRLV
jgi:hypothetical protein